MRLRTSPGAPLGFVFPAYLRTQPRGPDRQPGQVQRTSRPSTHPLRAQGKLHLPILVNAVPIDRNQRSPSIGICNWERVSPNTSRSNGSAEQPRMTANSTSWLERQSTGGSRGPTDEWLGSPANPRGARRDPGVLATTRPCGALRPSKVPLGGGPCAPCSISGTRLVAEASLTKLHLRASPHRSPCNTTHCSAQGPSSAAPRQVPDPRPPPSMLPARSTAISLLQREMSLKEGVDSNER